jgi:hypothetical protein
MRLRRLRAQERLRKRVIGVLLWTLTATIFIDVAVGFVFRLPSDPRVAGTALQNYFDYGRSIEGKLRRLVGMTPGSAAPIVEAGWLAKECDIGTTSVPGKIGFDIYGMSFTNQIADHMEGLDNELASTRFGGPAAPPNHSYACFLRRVAENRTLAPVQIIGILASSVRRMVTISGLTTSFEGPMPFTYPRYALTRDGQLEGRMSSISTEDDLRSALGDPQKWRAFKEDLSAADFFYSKAIFEEDAFDRSVVARMIRRALGQRVINSRTDALQTKTGFSGAPEIMTVLRAMLLDFAHKARERGSRPIVILIEDRGYGGTISTRLVPTLQESGIEFVSTSTLVAANDSGNFVADGHFTPRAFDKIAQSVVKLLRREPRVQSSAQ